MTSEESTREDAQGQEFLHLIPNNPDIVAIIFPGQDKTTVLIVRIDLRRRAKDHNVKAGVSFARDQRILHAIVTLSEGRDRVERGNQGEVRLPEPSCCPWFVGSLDC